MSSIDSSKSLIDILIRRSENHPTKTIYRFLLDGEADERTLTLGQLDLRSRSIAAHLQKNTSPGERALILIPSGLDFITAYFGSLMAGIIAVPVPPPHHARVEKSIYPTLRIINDAKPSVILLDKKLYEVIHNSPQLLNKFKGIRLLEISEETPDLSQDWKRPEISNEDVAFLQYTSGSTTAPKGVMVTHGNLISNLRAIETAMQLSEQNTSVFWLPPYHDMGLIGGILQTLFSGFTAILIPHLLFLQKPVRWLQAISKYKADTSGAPNFAYELCLKKIASEQLGQLDLSSWRIAMNGAEPLNKRTLDSFQQYFATCGFQDNTFVPCYGLAEATLMVTAKPKEEPYSSIEISRSALQENKVLLYPDVNNLQSVVSSGKCVDEHVLRVVDPTTSEICAHNEIGEIWFKGPCVTKGYWGKQEETDHSFKAHLKDTNEGPFLRTGDLGFLSDGQLFVTGRLKNLIIIDGKNFYPHDIEKAVQDSHFAIEPSGCAAFSLEQNGSEKLIIMVETRNNSHFSSDELINSVRKSISEEFSLSAEDVKLVPRGFIPRTTSGKIKHHECRSKYLLNESQ